MTFFGARPGPSNPGFAISTLILFFSVIFSATPQRPLRSASSSVGNCNSKRTGATVFKRPE